LLFSPFELCYRCVKLPENAVRWRSAVLRSGRVSASPAPAWEDAPKEEGHQVVDFVDRVPRVRFRRQLTVVWMLIALLAMAAPVSAGNGSKKGPLGNFKNIVVIYEENHSFDNLYGMWGDVNGQAVIGLPDALANHMNHTTQVD